MIIWECDRCHAEIPQEKEPENCPLCFSKKGFSQGEKPDQSDEDKKDSEKYKEVVEVLDKYEEGCDPRKLERCC